MLSAIILSGGRATRMGGVDKGLVLFQQRPLVAHVIERLRSQVDEMLINANREISSYEAFGLPVLQDISLNGDIDLSPAAHLNADASFKSRQPDFLHDFIGPLAGFSLGLQHACHDYVLTVPCDSPLMPLNLADRLLTALIAENADIAVATSGGNAHPVFCLCKKSVLPSLIVYINQGGRKVSAWQKSLNYTEVNFSDDHAFININSFEELMALHKT